MIIYKCQICQIFMLLDLIELSTIKSAGWAFHTGIQAGTNVYNSIFDKPCNCQEYPSSK